ncbi:hypothetical protein FA95DRAFT_1564619 [Auriscalpium vulgare]|uniref:Uncharacterized protein n=1 Tax=Auriscalpium vulgare TaxID=40419 RepID=A0ACB8RE11_9AGAM|nr:hypothetical protein FA95DRAFT_1564619 [Auriscalpium vulgare]
MESADALWSALQQWVHRFDGVSAESQDFRAVTRARQGLEQDRQQLFALKAIIEGRLNALTPVARLPSEILARIFSMVALDEPIVTHSRDYQNLEPGGPTSSAAKRMGWIKVTHVCHYWREVALAHPALWERVSFSIGPEWTEELLARSKGAPIIVDLRGAQPDSDHSWYDHLCNHLGHMKALYMDPKYTHIGFLALPAPMLEILDFCHSRYSGPLTVSPPLPIFADHAPRLRSLTLYCWNPTPWRSPLFNSLTYLMIKGDARRSSFPGDGERFPIFPSVDALVGALRSLESIETLILGDCLPLDSPNIGLSPSHTISLPRLTRLLVDGNFWKCGNFMSILRHADGFKAMFKCFAPSVTVEALQRVLPALTAHLHSSHSIAPSADRQPTLLVARSEHELGFGVWTTELSSADNDRSYGIFKGVEQYRDGVDSFQSDVSLHIFSRQAIPESTHIAMIGALFDHVDLRHIRHLHTHDCGTPEIWACLSACCPRTRRIDAPDLSTFSTVLQYLRTNINSEAAGHTRPASAAVAFPTLEVLVTKTYTLTKYTSPELEDDVVRARAEAGYPFEVVGK